MLGSVGRAKRFHLSDKRFADDEEVETEGRKCLRQQSKDYAAGFDALLKRWNKYINVGAGCVKK
jgi:nitrate reductase assembly molybdenum cofactor insertion protein NarJ